MNFFNLRLLQEPVPLFHNITARGKYTLDGYDMVAYNQNLYEEYHWDVHFRNCNVSAVFSLVSVSMTTPG